MLASTGLLKPGAESIIQIVLSALVAFALALAAPAYAQSADAATSFEVASVRRSAMPEGGRMGMQPGGRFVMVNGTAQTLISFAYNLRLDELIVGAPDWTRAETYDVNAKASNPAPSLDQTRLMLRNLLRERFNLRATPTQEERPVYKLVVARADGRLGSKLRKAEIDCDALRADIAAGKAPPMRPPPATGAVTPCTTRSRPASMESGGTTMAALATMLTGMVRRPVIDSTGLKGYFTYEMEFEPIALDAPDREPKLPSIFTALQEQLGLRLDAARAPVDVLVIDRIERPTPD